MVAYYVDRIKKGKMTLDQVPPRWLVAVEWEMEHGEKENLSK